MRILRKLKVDVLGANATEISVQTFYAIRLLYILQARYNYWNLYILRIKYNLQI